MAGRLGKLRRGCMDTFFIRHIDLQKCGIVADFYRSFTTGFFISRADEDPEISRS